jgi:TolB-like protein
MVAWTLSRRAPDIAIAVVRFHNETGQQANDQLAGTLTDAVVVALAENPRYGVIGNSPLLRTDRIFADANKIGQALAADYVLLGQLQSSDAGLVVRAHLIRSSDQKHVWAAPIALPASDREATLSAAIAAGISRALADQ